MNQIQNKYLSTNKIFWSAIITGTVVSLSIETVFNFLGIGLGLASLNSNNPRLFNLETGTILWLIVSGMVSMGSGGWFAGKFSNIQSAFNRSCHGLITWALATLLTISIATSTCGAFMGSAISIINYANLYEVSQTQNYDEEQIISIHHQPNMLTNKKESDPQIAIFIGNMSKVSIIIFMAFLLSAFASIVGSLFSYPLNKHNWEKELTGGD